MEIGTIKLMGKAFEKTREEDLPGQSCYVRKRQPLRTGTFNQQEGAKVLAYAALWHAVDQRTKYG